jgi:Na+-driven multidrug efflux pump
MPDSYSFSIAAQLQWVNLIYEIIQEAFILPLYFFIGKAFVDKKQALSGVITDEAEIEHKRSELTNRVRTGLLVVFGVYTLLSVIIMVAAEPLIRFMAQDPAVIAETATYIRLETIANIFATLVKFSMVVLVTIKKDRYLYFVLGLQVVLTILLDVFLISSFSVSAKLGVNGIAITNIIVNIMLLVLTVIVLHREDIKVFGKGKLSFAWAKEWTKVGGISGIESFVRNIAFMLMIVRMVNMVGEQGTFWVANNFIWGWLLLPVIQLGELVKRDCGENNREAIRQKTLGYFVLTTIFVVLWFISIPLWQPFMRGVLQLDNYKDIFFVVIISIGFYVLFAYNNVIDSIFYGIGKTNYMLFQSLVINIVVYGGAFIFYIAGIYHPTLVSIALMFAIGTALDSILTYGMFVWMLKKERLKIW